MTSEDPPVDYPVDLLENGRCARHPDAVYDPSKESCPACEAEDAAEATSTLHLPDRDPLDYPLEPPDDNDAGPWVKEIPEPADDPPDDNEEGSW